ncbi:MAG: DNA repair protein RadC [Oceanococcaceae bacterium]
MNGSAPPAALASTALTPPRHIKHWPADQRPREKLLRYGPGALADAELLAVFLRTGVAGQDALSMAHRLLRDCDGLRGLFSADREHFCRQRGLGDSTYVQVQAMLEMNRRFQAQGLMRAGPLTDSRSAIALLRSHLSDREAEVFCCVWLDTRHRLIRLDEMFQGTINGASVYPREVVRRALQLNAAAVILAHNHPSGVAEPSQSDRTITTRLQSALALVEVRVLDHFVIGNPGDVSFAERGWL